MLEAQKKLFEKVQTESVKPEKQAAELIMQQALANAAQAMKVCRQQDPMKTISDEQMYNLYKILYIPKQYLVQGFMSQRETMSTSFRKMSLLLHPDKNCHPDAPLAFRKLSEAYGAAKQYLGY